MRTTNNSRGTLLSSSKVKDMGGAMNRPNWQGMGKRLLYAIPLNARKTEMEYGSNSVFQYNIELS